MQIRQVKGSFFGKPKVKRSRPKWHSRIQKFGEYAPTWAVTQTVKLQVWKKKKNGGRNIKKLKKTIVVFG